MTRPTPRHRRRVLAGAAALAVFAAACAPTAPTLAPAAASPGAPEPTTPVASQPAAAPPPSQAGAPTVAPGAAPKVGDAAPAFAVTTVDGRRLTSAELLAERKPFVLFFWATW